MPVRRLTREQAKAHTRGQLLAAAERLFIRDGYHATTLEAVAEQAGYTKGAVYSAFESKADLFLAVFDGVVDRRLREIAALFERNPTPGSKLAALASRPIDERNQASFLLALEFWLYARGEPELLRRFAEHYGRLRAGIAELTAPAPARAGGLDAHEWATVTLALTNGISLERMIDPAGVPADLMARALGLIAGAPAARD